MGKLCMPLYAFVNLEHVQPETNRADRRRHRSKKKLENSTLAAEHTHTHTAFRIKKFCLLMQDLGSNWRNSADYCSTSTMRNHTDNSMFTQPPLDCRDYRYGGTGNKKQQQQNNPQSAGTVNIA